MSGFLINFFPLATIAVFVCTTISGVIYLNSARKLEIYLKDHHTELWKSLGKPSAFADFISQKNIAFYQFLNQGAPEEDGDTILATYRLRTRQLLRLTMTLVYCSIASFIFAIYIVQLISK